MSDKIQKIKQEIERLKHNTPNAYDLSRFMLLEEIESFIDSLPEEPASEDLKEYAKKLAKGAALDKHNLIWMCKKGAKWQKQKDEELFSEDAWNYIEENYPNITEEEKLRLYDISIKSRLAGAASIKKLVKEEMMKDAVEGEITLDINGDIRMDCADVFHVGDKVKIIIVKPE